MKKILRALAATTVLAVIFPLLPTSPAAANSTSSIGTTFDEAALFSPVASRDWATTMATAVDDSGNIYTASVVRHSASLLHTRQLGVNENYVVGRGVRDAPNLVVTKVDKDGQMQWVWELRAVAAGTFGWWRDIAVAPDGTVHVVGYYKGRGDAWHHKAGDDPRDTVTEDATLIKGDWEMPWEYPKTNGQWVQINPDGTTRNINRLKSNGSSFFTSVDVNDAGQVLIGGRYQGQTWFNMKDHSNSGWKEMCKQTCPFITMYEAGGAFKWGTRFNHCPGDEHSAVWDARFGADGRIIVVGGYTGEAKWHCGPAVTSALGARGLGNGFATKLHTGSRSYMAFFNASNGQIEYAREFGSPTQRSNAIAVVEHPTNGDLYTVGLWENTRATCTTVDHKWYFAPTIPSADFPRIGDHSRFTRTGGVVGCAAHESGPKNDDVYLLHTDKWGNFKNVSFLDPHLEKAYLPAIAINSDGSELAIAGSGIPISATGLTNIQARGSNGWVMTVDSATLVENWRWVNKQAWHGDNTDKYQWSWTHDVAYGPEDKVHAVGRATWSTWFGTTDTGTFAFHHNTKTEPDGFVVRYTNDGAVDLGAPPDVPQVAPDGYGIVTPEAIEDDGIYLIGPGGEVVWNEPLCAGGRWQLTPQPGLAVRQYMLKKAAMTTPLNLADGSGGDPIEPADVIRTLHTGPNGTVPNYNILWQDGYALDADGSSADVPENFKLRGWDDGVTDLDSTADLPVGFYFRQNTIVYNTNSNPGGRPVYSPTTRVDGHTWDLDEYDVYLAFAHPGGSTERQTYPEFTQICPSDDGIPGFTLTKTTLFTDEDGKKDKFNFQLDSRPTSEVVFNITWTDASEISVSHSDDVIKFDKDNWDNGRRVTATGLPDGVPDGDITSYINVQIDHDASSYEYASLANKIVDVVNENVDLLPPPPNPDLDGDGIPNEDEVDGCVLLADCDGDGINDPNEIPACILVADCDGDGLPDNQELPECIQDPRCDTDNNNPVEDEKPEVTDPEPVKPENPPAPEPPPIEEPPETTDPQTPVIPEPQDPPNTETDTDGDGVPDDQEEPGCETVADCDGDGLPDGTDSEPNNPDVDNDGLPDGLDPDPANPDTDGDGIPDGEDEDSDGNGIPDNQEQGVPGSGLPEEPTDTSANTPGDGDSDGSDDDGSDSDGNGDVGVQAPQATPGASSSDKGFINAIGDLPPAAIAAAALVAAVGLAAAAASLAGPGLLSWLFRGALGIWLFGLLFGRKGVRCDVCDVSLVKRDGIWVDKDTHWRTGINEHIHVPADFSDKDRVRYLNSLK